MTELNIVLLTGITASIIATGIALLVNILLNRKQRADEISNEIQELKLEIQSVRTEMRSVKDEMKNGFDAVNVRIDKVEVEHSKLSNLVHSLVALLNER